MELPRILHSCSQSQRTSSYLSSARDPRRYLLWLDASYTGQQKGAGWVHKVWDGPPRSCDTHRSWLPKRLIVERTLAWLAQNRRMSKDYERLAESSEAFICVATSRLMARRLARS
jgi:putative transposase